MAAKSPSTSAPTKTRADIANVVLSLAGNMRQTISTPTAKRTVPYFAMFGYDIMNTQSYGLLPNNYGITPSLNMNVYSARFDAYRDERERYRRFLQ